MLYPSAEGGAGLERALDRLREQAQEAVARRAHGDLSSRTAASTGNWRRFPSLLATAGVHHHLVREGLRTRCALVVETGDAREVHHVALLIGYGAGAVNPVPGVRDAGRHDPAARHRGGDPRARGAQLHQGAQQGHPESHVEDGDLDAAELLRRADLRGDRPRQGLRRSLLHLDGVAHRRRRHRRDRPRSARAPPPRVPERATCWRRSSRPAANTSGAATASCTCSTRRRSTSCSTRPGASIRDLQGVHGARQRSEPQPRHAARAARLQAGVDPGAAR